MRMYYSYEELWTPCPTPKVNRHTKRYAEGAGTVPDKLALEYLNAQARYRALKVQVMAHMRDRKQLPSRRRG